MPDFVTVDGYPEQEAYFEELAMNLEIQRLDRHIARKGNDIRWEVQHSAESRSFYRDNALPNALDSLIPGEIAIQIHEQIQAIYEYRQWCIMHGVDCTAPSLYEF